MRAYSVRMVRVSLTSLLVLVAAGCSEPRTDFAPLRPGVCAEEQVPCEDGHAWVEVPRDFEPRTLVYVIDTLSIPVADAEGRVPGFDLDGMDSGVGTASGTCEERSADYESSVDPRLSGVDNRFQELVSTLEGLLDRSQCPGETTDGCLDVLVQRAVDEGGTLYLLELSGIESFAIDDGVDVALYRASADGGAPVLGPEGRIAPGQTFSGELVAQARGTILGGRVAVELERFPYELTVLEIPMDLRRPQFRFDLVEGALQRGVIGAPWLIAELPTTDLEPRCSTVHNVADMSVEDPLCCVAPGDCCNAMSVGLAFTATRAERRP
jgi:hypothetical protein